MLDLVTGDSPSFALTAKKDNAVFAIGAGATIKASLLDKNKNTLIAAVTASELATGADWANSLVVVSFTVVETTAVTYSGLGFIELQIDDDDNLTWFYKVDIQAGTII